MEIRIVSKGGALPAYATEGSSGADLRAYIEEPITLMPGERRLVPTGLSLKFRKALRHRSEHAPVLP